MNVVRRVGVLVGVALALAIAAAPAQAEVRGAAVDDPADSIATVSGVPNFPDVSRVEVWYALPAS